jgi:hypothetical protein
MARFLKRIMLFLLFAMPIYAALLFAAGVLAPKSLVPNLYNQQNAFSFLRERIHELPAQRGVDVLVLGTSVGQRGIDPRVAREQGVALFNLSSGGQQPSQSFILLQRYLDTLRPKMVLLTVFPDFLASDDAEPAVDLVLSDRVDADNFHEAIRLRHPLLFNTLAYRWMRQELSLPDFSLHFENQNDRYISGGFVERKRPGFNGDAAYRCNPGPDWPLHPAALRYLDSCIIYLKKKEVPYVLMQLPIAAGRYRCYRNKQKADSLFASKGMYYNLNGKLPLDDSLHFLDNTHLNPSGAHIVTRAIADTLRASPWLR